MYRHKKTRISTQSIRVFYYLCPIQPPPKNVLFVLIFGTFRFADYKSRIWVGYNNDYLKKHKREIPYWLSVRRYGFANAFIAMGIVEQHKNKFKLWDKKAAVKGLTPIETKEEALYFLYLMEYVVPDDNFNELCEKKGIYKIYTDTMTPTIIKEEKDYFVTNLFYYDVIDGSLFEIVYQLYKNGKYNILSKKRIYIILKEEWE